MDNREWKIEIRKLAAALTLFLALTAALAAYGQRAIVL